MLRRPAFWSVVFLLAAAGVAGVTAYALESNEVVVFRTFDSAGGMHEARVWIVDDLGYSWIEAAGPDKLFYTRLLEEPAVEVERAGRTYRHRAVPDRSRRAHDRLRSLLSAKYGWADEWIGLFVDTSGSIAVRLEPR
jgi:hypothetical protein